MVDVLKEVKGRHAGDYMNIQHPKQCNKWGVISDLWKAQLATEK